jgi:heat shock protein HslJ
MVAKRLVYFLIAILALFLFACGSVNDVIPVTGRGSTETSLANTRWNLVSYGEPGSETPVIQGTGVTLHFQAGGAAGGSAGCNTFGAQYEVMGDNQLSITQIASTSMDCSDIDLMKQEAGYLDALRSAESFELSGETLTIHYGDGVLNFSRLTSKTPNTVNL